MSKTVAALQYVFEGRNLAAENHKVVVYAAERRAPMHRTGTVVSALPPKPIFVAASGMPALGHKRTWSDLFNHLVRAGEQCRRHRGANRFGCFEIDH